MASKNFVNFVNNWCFTLVVLFDIISVLLPYYIISLIFIGEFNPLLNRFILFVSLLLIVNNSSYKLYLQKRSFMSDLDVIRIFYSYSLTFGICVILAYLLQFGNIIFLITFFLLYVLAFLFSILFRSLLFICLSFFRKRGFDVVDVYFFGDDKGLKDKIQETSLLGYNIVGFSDDILSLKHHIKSVDLVFIAKDDLHEEVLDVVMSHPNVHFKIVSSIFNLIIEPVAFDEFKDYPILNVRPVGQLGNYYFFKRLIDIVISTFGIIVLSPIFLIVAFIIKLSDKGPVFYVSRRLGENLKYFNMYKFRSMSVGADKIERDSMKSEVEGLFKIKEHPKVTRFGKFLRRTALDELPQLFNVFIGNMSIVGPRPFFDYELPAFKGWRRLRFSVKPGLTGMWQVSGRHQLNFDKAVLYDIYYIRQMSLRLDLEIMLRTIPSILLSRGRH